ncbi:hypothetical protein Ancab_023334 [Ancistrocladus abbreviatus]
MEEKKMTMLTHNQDHHETTTQCKEIFIDDNDGDEDTLPGFRFHPTDEELVSFYLRRKVEKKPISIELIKQIDIYKHDPWDLAKGSSLGDKEWYFYCKRGRKYKNSIRPNRVTRSGFWKATGIDRPIYSNRDQGGDHHKCIGLKKSLVYYSGSAGKGTKTDWMMHEFRLPDTYHQPQDHATQPDAEIWTLCRIFKRKKRYTPDWREVSGKKSLITMSANTIRHAEPEIDDHRECYISFQNYDENNKTYCVGIMNPPQHKDENGNNLYLNGSSQRSSGTVAHTPLASASPCSSAPLSQPDATENQFFASYGHSWDDLNSIVDPFAARTPLL